MDMSEVEDMNMLEDHVHLSNHRSEEEDMDMVGIHMVEVEDMDMAGIHMVEVEGMDMVERRPSKERQEFEGMDMMEDMMAEVDVEVVEREHEGVVLDR
jgi:hypothetical protein